MASLKDLWPEEGSRFADLEPAFVEETARGGAVVVTQRSGETRADFELRLLATKPQHPASALFVCVVREVPE